MPQGLLFPSVNSEILVPYNQALPNIYNTRHLNTNLFQNSIPRFQSYNDFWNKKCPNYFQLKQFDDDVVLSFDVFGYQSIDAKWLKSDGTEIPFSATPEVSLIPGNTYDADGQIDPVPVYTYNIAFKVGDDLSDAGIYFIVYTIVGGDSIAREYISEPYSVKQKWPDTVLLQYSNSKPDFDVYWPYVLRSMSLRIPGYLSYTRNTLERATFRDQESNLRLDYARDWRIFTLYVGVTMAPYGIPPYLCDKLAKIQKVDTLFIDGKRFIMEDGSEFEPTKYTEAYPVMGLSIEFAEYYSRNSDQSVSGDVLIMFRSGDSGGYPYALTQLTLTKAYGSGSAFVNLLEPYVNGIKEVFDTTEEAALLVSLNADIASKGLTGYFYRDSLYTYFVCGENEGYSKQSSQLNKTLQLSSYFGAGTNVLGISITSNTFTKMVVSMWSGSSNVRSPIYYDNTTTNKANVNQPIGSVTTFGTVYIYHNDEMSVLSLNGNATAIIRGVSGVAPAKLLSFDMQNFIINTFNPTWLTPTAKTIKNVGLRYGHIVSFTTAPFAVIEPGDWQQLTGMQISNNDMTTTTLNSYYNGIYATIYAAHYTTKFVLDSRNQTTGQTPDAGSLAERNAMIAAGNFIFATP